MICPACGYTLIEPPFVTPPTSELPPIDENSAIIDSQRIEITQLAKQIDKLQNLVRQQADRIAAQSELLSKAAEKRARR